jgi:lactoylglutathione lyase
VDDYATMFRFYRDTIELPVSWGDEGSGYASFGTGDYHIAIFERRDMARAIGSGFTAPGPGPQDRAMLVFAVDDVDATYRLLLDRGVESVAVPQDRPDWGIRTAHLRDPEGNLIEINQPLPGDSAAGGSTG